MVVASYLLACTLILDAEIADKVGVQGDITADSGIEDSGSVDDSGGDSAEDSAGDSAGDSAEDSGMDPNDVDDDVDGFTETQGDCDDTLATVNPGAAEFCDDGIDNDCEGTDASCGEIVTLHGIDFVRIAASTFEMGCTAGQTDCGTDETVHTVTLTQDYYVSATEVTQTQFEDMMGYNPSFFSGCGNNCPVESVDWHESAAFANELSMAGGLELCYACTGSGTSSECSVAINPYDCGGYRLLTEAEWEGAARCGEDLPYAGSVTLDDISWYVLNSGDTPHAVGGKDPNACGLYDMTGNVYEWTQDLYDTLSASAASDPTGAAVGTNRIDRGGGWYSDTPFLRVSNRSNYAPTDTSTALGIRLARSNP